MLEQVIKELLLLRNINLTAEERYDLTRFWQRPHPERKQLSAIKKWADKLDVPVSLLVNTRKYDKLEEIWKL